MDGGDGDADVASHANAQEFLLIMVSMGALAQTFSLQFYQYSVVGKLDSVHSKIYDPRYLPYWESWAFSLVHDHARFIINSSVQVTNIIIIRMHAPPRLLCCSRQNDARELVAVPATSVSFSKRRVSSL